MANDDKIIKRSDNKSVLLYLRYLRTNYCHNMITTTTNNIEGKPVQKYLGVVTSEAIIGANIMKDIFAGIRDIVGGRSGSYERVLQEGKETAMRELIERANAMGANAIIGIDLDFETVGSGTMMMVVATGTAVVI